MYICIKKQNYIPTMFVDLAIFVLEMQACGGTIDCNGVCDGGATTDGCGACDDNDTNDCVVQLCDGSGYDADCNTCKIDTPTMGVRELTPANENVLCNGGANVCDDLGVCGRSK